MAEGETPLGPIRAAMAAIGTAFIYLLIRLFGRSVSRAEVPWLWGPFGGEYIADRPYEECAASEGLTLTRHAETGGLIPSFAALDGDGFAPAAVDERVRDSTSGPPSTGWMCGRRRLSLRMWGSGCW